MINLNVARDFSRYQQRLLENPDAVGYCLPSGVPSSVMHIVQYHNTGKEIFGAIFVAPGNDPCRDFRAYLPKVELN
jgi:hypothetical protein